MSRKRRRSIQVQRRLDFADRPRRRSGKGSRSAWKVWLSCALLFTVGMVLLFAYVKLNARVFDFRIARAYQVALKVLALTSRSQADQQRYAKCIARNCVEKGLNPAVVSAIVVVESNGNPLTVSPTGDLGLMQVNARIHAHIFDFERRNLLNPEENLDVGTSILKTMVDRHGDERAIQAYNGLLPEKREYSVRVQNVLSRAGLTPQRDTVSSNPGLLARISDWISATGIWADPS